MSESRNIVWFGDGSTDQKKGERAGGGLVKDFEILFASDVD